MKESRPFLTSSEIFLEISSGSAFLSAPAFADDAASGMPSGKRQHKPVSATQPQEETEETKGTRVRKPMQDLKNNAQDTTPAMNKAELTETLSSNPGLSKADSKRVAEDEKTDKNEAARSKRKK